MRRVCAVGVEVRLMEPGFVGSVAQLEAPRRSWLEALGWSLCTGRFSTGWRASMGGARAVGGGESSRPLALAKEDAIFALPGEYNCSFLSKHVTCGRQRRRR